MRYLTNFPLSIIFQTLSICTFSLNIYNIVTVACVLLITSFPRHCFDLITFPSQLVRDPFSECTSVATDLYVQKSLRTSANRGRGGRLLFWSSHVVVLILIVKQNHSSMCELWWCCMTAFWSSSLGLCLLYAVQNESSTESSRNQQRGHRYLKINLRRSFQIWHKQQPFKNI